MNNELKFEDEYIQIGSEVYSVDVDKQLTDLMWSPTAGKAELFAQVELPCNCGEDCGKKLIIHPSGLEIEVADGSSEWADFDPERCTAMYWWVVNNREIPFEV